MSISSSIPRPHVFDPDDDLAYPELRRIAASKLQPFRYHQSGGGSEYVYIGDTKIRFADHKNTSRKHTDPDLNIVDSDELTGEQLREIEKATYYPELCQKTAFAKHVGLTVPKLKKLLTSQCYKSVCLDPEYPNTYTELVIVRVALERVRADGIMAAIPIAQERWSDEDYHPGYY